MSLSRAVSSAPRSVATRVAPTLVLSLGLALGLGLGLAPSAHAEFPGPADEAETVSPGGWEVEASLDIARGRAPGSRETEFEAEVELSYGLIRDLTVSIEVPLSDRREREAGEVERASGVGDVELALKWRFLRNGPLSMGLKGAVLLPTGSVDSELGTGKIGSRLFWIASWRELDAYELNLNLGATFPRYSEEASRETARSSVPFVALGGTYNLDARWKLAAGVLLERSAFRDEDDNTVSVTLGAIYNFGGGRELGFRVIEARQGKGDSRSTAIGVGFKAFF